MSRKRPRYARARGMRCDVTRAMGVGVMVMSCARRRGGGGGVERAGERVRRARRWGPVITRQSSGRARESDTDVAMYVFDA